MKIISNKECYVQRDDIEYLIENDRNIPSELFFELSMSIINDNDFVKIQNPIALQYILQSNIPSFEELNALDKSKLDEMLFKLKMCIFDCCDESEEENLDEIIRERRNLEYIIKQLKEIIAYKKGTSKLNYPNIPNPNSQSIEIDNYIANKSLNMDTIVIYDIDGKELSATEDIEMCKMAYKVLYETDEDISIHTFMEGKYLVVENFEYYRQMKRTFNKSRF